MSHVSLDSQLDLLESHFEALAAHLIDGSPLTLQTHSATLQRLAVELIQMVDLVGRAHFESADRIRRVKALANGVARLRENLLRQLAYVGRALEVVVPATREKATYSGGATYGQAARQSGAFKVLAA